MRTDNYKVETMNPSVCCWDLNSGKIAQLIKELLIIN